MDWEEFMEYWEDSSFRGQIDGEASRASNKNESCGDQIDVALLVVNGRIATAKWEGKGCVLSQASAAYLCQRSIGSDLKTALEFEIKLKPEPTPYRQKCVALAVKTFREALNAASGNTGECVGSGGDNPTGPSAVSN